MPLDAFRSQPRGPEAAAIADFERVLKAHALVNGNFYTQAGIRTSIGGIVQKGWTAISGNTCQAGSEGLYEKGTPAPATNRNRGWRGALQRPARLPVLHFHSPGPSRQWTGALCYLVSAASNSTTARAISETMIKRLMAVLLFRLAPRRAQAV